MGRCADSCILDVLPLMVVAGFSAPIQWMVLWTISLWTGPALPLVVTVQRLHVYLYTVTFSIVTVFDTGRDFLALFLVYPSSVLLGISDTTRLA